MKYGIDLKDENNYDLIIDTSYSTVSDIADTILECANCYYSDKEFGKKWASPKIFLPLQSIRETFKPTFLGVSLDELREDIKENGYYPDSDVIATDDEMIPGTQNSARQRIESLTLGKLYDHEVIIKNFSYEEIYPNIYQKIKDMQDQER